MPSEGRTGCQGSFGNVARTLLLTTVLGGTVACGARPGTPTQVPTFTASNQVITPTEEFDEAELLALARAAIRHQDWAEANNRCEVLLSATSEPSVAEECRYILVQAAMALRDESKAIRLITAVLNLHPSSRFRRSLLVDLISLEVLNSAWEALDGPSDDLLATQDVATLDTTLAFAAKALAALNRDNTAAAQKFLRSATDLVEDYHLGEGGRSPFAVSVYWFAKGELHRRQSENVALTPAGEDFGGKLEARCEALLAAQRAFAQAMHGVEPRIATMAGYRVGELYFRLHKDVMAIPEPTTIQTGKDRQIFYAAMHLRYRILLEKALRMMDGTVDLASKVDDPSDLTTKALETKLAIEAVLQQEGENLKKFPFTEAEMQKALEMSIARAARAQAPKGRPVPSK